MARASLFVRPREHAAMLGRLVSAARPAPSDRRSPSRYMSPQRRRSAQRLRRAGHPSSCLHGSAWRTVRRVRRRRWLRRAARRSVSRMTSAPAVSAARIKPSHAAGWPAHSGPCTLAKTWLMSRFCSLGGGRRAKLVVRHRPSLKDAAGILEDIAQVKLHRLGHTPGLHELTADTIAEARLTFEDGDLEPTSGKHHGHGRSGDPVADDDDVMRAPDGFD